MKVTDKRKTEIVKFSQIRIGQVFCYGDYDDYYICISDGGAYNACNLADGNTMCLDDETKVVLCHNVELIIHD